MSGIKLLLHCEWETEDGKRVKGNKEFDISMNALMHLGVFHETYQIKGLTEGNDGVKRLVMPQVYDLDKVDWETYMIDLVNIASLFHIKENRFDPSNFPIPFDEELKDGKKKPAKLEDYISAPIYKYLLNNGFLKEVHKIVELIILSKNAGFLELKEVMAVVAAIHHRGQTAEQILKSFGLTSDFTLDEINTIKGQTTWDEPSVQTRVEFQEEQLLVKKVKPEETEKRIRTQIGSKFVPTFKTNIKK